MMTGGKHEGDTPEEDDAALWSLLERAPKPGPVSPYFARRVLREVAALTADASAREKTPGWWTRVRHAWQGQGRGVFAGALGAVALLAAGAGLSPLRWHSPVAPVAAAHVAPNIQEVEPSGDPMGEIDGSSSPRLVSSEPTVTAQDVEVIADLDNLLSHEESRLWTEDDTTARF